jgi:hypothetical protein
MTKWHASIEIEVTRQINACRTHGIIGALKVAPFKECSLASVQRTGIQPAHKPTVTGFQTVTIGKG